MPIKTYHAPVSIYHFCILLLLLLLLLLFSFYILLPSPMYSFHRQVSHDLPADTV